MRIDAGIELAVEDNGKVISNEDIARITEHVRDSDFLPDNRGRGVGLLIVREVIDSLGGTIAFEKRSPRGLIVRIVFSDAIPDNLEEAQ